MNSSSNVPRAGLIKTAMGLHLISLDSSRQQELPIEFNKGLAAGYRHKAALQACCCIQCTTLACTRHQKWKTEPAGASRKKWETQAHLFCHRAKTGENQTSQAKVRTPHRVKAACNEAQTHFQRPFAGHVTFFLRDACTPFSSAKYSTIPRSG